MPQVIETTVYTIDELSDAAKENARIWYRDQGLHDQWYDFVCEDFETICEISRRHARHHPRAPLWRRHPQQAAGVVFRFQLAGRRRELLRPVQLRPGRRQGHTRHAPKDAELHRIADELQAVQRKNFHQLHASIRQQGRYCHEYTMAIEVERDSPTWQPPTDDAEDTVTEAMRDLARWLYRQLRSEYEHLTSDDTVDEIVAVNAWTFTADGTRFG